MGVISSYLVGLLVYAYLTWWYPSIFSIMSTWLMTGKGGARALLLLFALVHIHIYPKSRFSIKTIPSNLLSCLTNQKGRRFWLIPVNCGGFPLCLFVAAFESGAHQIYLLSWVSMGLLLFGFAKLIDLGLIPSRMDFGIQLRWTALASLRWVLMWVPPQSLVFPSSVDICTDGTHVFPSLLLWLNGWFASCPSLTFAFKKFSYFSECTECHLTESLVLQGTVAALMMALTWHSLRFECLSSQLASSFLMMWWLIQALDWHGRWNGQPLSTSWSLLSRWDHFVQIIVGGLAYLLWSLCLMWWWKCLKGKFPDLTRASHGRSGSDVDHCRGLHLPNMAVPLGVTTKERGFQPWWLKASASFWFMD